MRLRPVTVAAPAATVVAAELVVMAMIAALTMARLEVGWLVVVAVIVVVTAGGACPVPRAHRDAAGAVVAARPAPTRRGSPDRVSSRCAPR